MSIIKQKTKIIQCCFSKMNREQRHQYHVIGGDTLTLSKVTKYLIININWTRSLKCWILLSKTYLSSLVDRCFKRRSLFQCVHIVLHNSLPCFYILMRQTSFKLNALLFIEVPVPENGEVMYNIIYMC